MREITRLARAKINIGLDVTGRREDGYHMVRMIMQTVALADTVVIKRTKIPGISMRCSIDTLPVDGDNLCVKAARLLVEEFALTDGIAIDLTKRIPIAAGMAGGSTDAAAVLMCVNELFELGLTKEELAQRAVRIGADVPYCIFGGTMLSEGIGEILTPIAPLGAYPIVIAKPDIDVSTKYVYTAFDALEKVSHPDIDAMIRAIEKDDLEALSKEMGNVLADVTEARYPIISEIKNVLLGAGASVAMMSGSGPSVFAVFTDEKVRDQAAEKLIKTGLASFVEASYIYNPTKEEQK